MNDKVPHHRIISGRKLVTFEASPEWVAWADRFADQLTLSRTATIDQAMRRLATDLGFPEPPPKR